MTDQLSLRERKKHAAMRRIQTVALDLFERDGFDQVTIETIAEVSEVSPSSVYRYFGTKERIVIWDEYDPMAIAAIVEELDQHSPIEAVRRVVAGTLVEALEADRERIHRRLRLAYGNPAIEAASALQGYEMATLIAEVIARGSGRSTGDLDVQVFAHAFVGGILGAMRHWQATGFEGDVLHIAERPLAMLEHGFQFD